LLLVSSGFIKNLFRLFKCLDNDIINTWGHNL
jgi:hypothetical protein